MNYRVKTPVLKDLTIVCTTDTGEQRIVLTLTHTDVDTVREAVKAACTSRVIAYRVELAAISKKAA